MPPARSPKLWAVDESRFQAWLDRYVQAWQSYDEDAIGALFNADAEYRYHAWDDGDEVVKGRDAIVASWLDDRDEPGSWSAEYHPWAIDGERAVAVGVSRYFAADGRTVESEYHNVFLCVFDDEGRCREFTEIYAKRPA